jgi:hypothetical protein
MKQHGQHACVWVFALRFALNQTLQTPLVNWRAVSLTKHGCNRSNSLSTYSRLCNQWTNTLHVVRLGNVSMSHPTTQCVFYSAFTR